MATPKKDPKDLLQRGRKKEKLGDKMTFDNLFMLCEKGFTDDELAVFYKVCKKTINNWKKDPEFLTLLKKGKDMADSKVERSLYERACGYSHPEDKIFNNNGKEMIVKTIKHYPPDPVSAIFWLKNRQPERWRDVQEIKGENGFTPPPPLVFNVVPGVEVKQEKTKEDDKE